jgi:hypothetical protein
MRNLRKAKEEKSVGGMGQAEQGGLGSAENGGSAGLEMRV